MGNSMTEREKVLSLLTSRERAIVEDIERKYSRLFYAIGRL